ncbi:MAG: nitrate- and nitrite sensing domain-containing protein, partial [Pseudonocardiaceae bacterium]
MTAPARVRHRWHWRNWPVLLKLVAVLLVPTVVALVVGVLRIVDEANAAPGFDRIVEVAGVQRDVSALVGELERERDLAAAYVAGGRQGDRLPLEQQFDATDAAKERVAGSAGQVEGLRNTGYQEILDQLGGLVPLRQSVTVGVGAVDVAVAEYGAAVDPLLGFDAALVRQLDDVTVTGQAAALHALLTAREQVARQHALVLPALSADRFSPSGVDAVRAADVRLQAELEAFQAALTPAGRARYADLVSGEREDSRQRVIRLVLDRAQADEPLVTLPADWDARSAAVVEQMTQAQDELRGQIVTTATELRDGARASAGWNAVILLFALALGVLVGFLIARSMLKPLGVLRRTALDVAARRLPAAMASVRGGAAPEAVAPVPVYTREEIGQVARAFDEVHAQAVRLAAEQAQLRGNVNDIFVNLSRRSQSLVQRQLKLIDQLEGNEQDPEALDNLFQLDHLATRMRRNSENLLVLAGTESARRTARPVRLVDVLRASVSEVEQYQRIALQPPPGVLVLGRAASDLVHLLAELLDNAAQFSPPDSQVMISGRSEADGSVVIEIDDRGVGMRDADLAEANARLATSPAVDASVSRRMGLFVVGRLAARHGIAVELRRSEGGAGVTASIHLPSRLARPAVTAEDGGRGTDTTAATPAGGGTHPALNGKGAAPASATTGGDWTPLD